MEHYEKIDRDEFLLFLKFNNRNERRYRHVDLYYVDRPEQHDRIRINEEKLEKDTLEQMTRMKEYFSADLDLNSLIDNGQEKRDEKD